MALTVQVIGCSSSFINGGTLIGVRGSPSLCKRAMNLSPRSMQGEDSSVEYQDPAKQWLSADFLDLRLRSSGLVYNEAIRALRNHFQKKDEQPVATATTVIQQLQEQAPPSASQIKTRPLPNVIVLDAAFSSEMYNSSSTYTKMCSFLDESFC